MHTPTPTGPRIRPHRRVTGSEAGTAVRTITPAVRGQAHPGDAASARARHPAHDRGAALWLHLDLPRLPLEVLTRGGAGNPERACVLTAGEGTRRRVLMTDARAAALGVRAGMPLGAAHALGELTVLTRDERAEARALEKLCLWAMQLSPLVSPVAPDGVLVEVRGSLKLFGGVDGLRSWLRRGLKALGYHVQCALAPTPLAATALARAGGRAAVLEPADLGARLAPLPLSVLRLDARDVEALEGVGVRNIGECRRLPRGGLARRFSPALLDTLDRLFGRTPDPRASLAVPPCFQAALELPWELDNARALGLAGERLLHELAGYLRANDAATRELRWHLTHRDGSRTRFDIGLTRAERDVDHLRLLLREKLARLRIGAPVRALELYVGDVVRGALPRTTDLFGNDDAADAQTYAGFADRLRSRCGEQVLKGLDVRSDHRPERAWRWRRPESGPREACSPAGGSGASAPRVMRPLWLMKQPLTLETREGRPHFHGPLDLRPERERIDTGWWDGQAVARDYFVATTRDGSRLWIYRELDGERRWRLHGLFE